MFKLPPTLAPECQLSDNVKYLILLPDSLAAGHRILPKNTRNLGQIEVH